MIDTEVPSGFLEKLRDLDRQLSEDDRVLSFLALAEDGPRWDLVVSAPWVTDGALRGMRIISEKLKAILSPRELLSVTRIVPLDEGHPFLVDVGNALETEKVAVTLTGHVIDGVLFDRIHVIKKDRQANLD